MALKQSQKRHIAALLAQGLKTSEVAHLAACSVASVRRVKKETENYEPSIKSSVSAARVITTFSAKATDDFAVVLTKKTEQEAQILSSAWEIRELLHNLAADSLRSLKSEDIPVTQLPALIRALRDFNGACIEWGDHISGLDVLSTAYAEMQAKQGGQAN